MGDAEKGRVVQYITGMDKIVIKFPSLDTEFLGIYCLFFFFVFFFKIKLLFCYFIIWTSLDILEAPSILINLVVWK